MATYSGSKSGGDWKGVGDGRPSADPKANPAKGDYEPAKCDWRGEMDSRPDSAPKSPQSINISGKG